MKEKSISYIKKHLFNILHDESINILSIISSDYNIDNLDKYIDEDDIKKILIFL